MGTWRTFDVTGVRAVNNAVAVLDEAFAAGARLFDTSPMYGESEYVLARALVGRRAQALGATKVSTPSRDIGRQQIARALAYYEGHVDLYQVHNLVNWKAHLDV